MLRDAFTNVPVLRHYDPEKHTRIETDASDFAIAGILSQLQDSAQWHPVAFWSRKIIPAERNYKTYDKELLAIVMVLKQWRHYCEGSLYPIEVLTDHNNLKHFINIKELNGRQARWAMKLSMFDFVISHRPGRTNPADAPSRRPDYTGANTSINLLLPTLQQKLANIAGIYTPMFEAIRKAYGLDTPAGGEAQKVGVTHAVHGIHAVQTQHPAVEAKAKLLGSMLAAVNETRSSHVIRLRKPPPQSRGSSGEMPAQTTCNVAGIQLNPVTGTVSCKQLVLRVVASVIASHETAYTPESESIVQLVKALQLKDPWVSSYRQGNGMDDRIANAGSWI